MWLLSVSSIDFEMANDESAREQAYLFNYLFFFHFFSCVCIVYPSYHPTRTTKAEICDPFFSIDFEIGNGEWARAQAYPFNHLFFILFFCIVYPSYHTTRTTKAEISSPSPASISRLGMASGRGHRHTYSITYLCFIFFSCVCIVYSSYHPTRTTKAEICYHFLASISRLGMVIGRRHRHIPIQSTLFFFFFFFFFFFLVLCFLHILQLAPPKLRCVLFFQQRFRGYEMRMGEGTGALPCVSLKVLCSY